MILQTVRREMYRDGWGAGVQICSYHTTEQGARERIKLYQSLFVNVDDQTDEQLEAKLNATPLEEGAYLPSTDCLRNEAMRFYIGKPIKVVD